MNNKIEKIADLIYTTLDYMYCDNCRFSSEITEDEVGYYRCEDCHRKYNEWGISKSTSLRLANKIIEIIEVNK